jgi:hypothetical protein
MSCNRVDHLRVTTEGATRACTHFAGKELQLFLLIYSGGKIRVTADKSTDFLLFG